MKYKIGDIVIPKYEPELADEIIEMKDFANELVYVLENGCMFTDNELQ